MKNFLFISLIIFIWCAFINAQSIVKKFYYSSGKLKSEISFSDSLRDGPAKFYYENGNLKEERNYVNGRVEGTVKLYYKNGNLSEIFSLLDGKREGSTSLFDSTGNYVGDVSYTTGKQDRKNLDMESSEKMDSTYESKSYVVEDSKTRRYGPPGAVDIQRSSDPAYFINLDVEPRPVGGMTDIYSRLVYPEEVLKNNIQGTVVVLAFINEKGNVDDMTVLQGLCHDCDEAAKNAIRYTKFHPGFLNKAPVKSQLKISIEFKNLKK